MAKAVLVTANTFACTVKAGMSRIPCYRVVDIPVHQIPAHTLRGHVVHTAIRCLYIIRGLHKLAYMRYSKNFNLSYLAGLGWGGGEI